jgi:hypothetical protein
LLGKLAQPAAQLASSKASSQRDKKTRPKKAAGRVPAVDNVGCMVVQAL